MNNEERIDDEFARLLGEQRIEEMNAYPDSVYGLWEDYRIAYLNPAWFRFAEENGGGADLRQRWGIGASVAESIPDVLKKWFEFHLDQCARKQAPWSYDYECSSDTMYRLFHQTTYPVGEAQGFLVVNTLILQEPHDPVKRPARPADESHYVDQQGRVRQCSHCRKVMHLEDHGSYHWVPEWVKKPLPHIMHTLCLGCTYTFFPLE